MKKKKLKQRIANLESELATARSNDEVWRSMFDCVMSGLKGYGVKTEIIPVNPTATVPPTLSLDFTEHHKEIEIRNTRKILENYRKLLGRELEFEKE